MADDTPTLADIGNWLPDYVKVQNYQWPFANAAPRPAVGTYGFSAADMSAPAVPSGYSYNAPAPAAAAPYIPAGVRGYAGELISDRPTPAMPQQPSFLANFLAGWRARPARQVPALPLAQLGAGMQRMGMIGRGVRGI